MGSHRFFHDESTRIPPELSSIYSSLPEDAWGRLSGIGYSPAITEPSFEVDRAVTLEGIVKVWPPMNDGPRLIGALPALAIHRALGGAARDRARRVTPRRHHESHGHEY